MTFTLVMLAPNAAANQTFTAGVSGTSYTSDVYGFVKNVVPQDVSALVSGGCLSLGQSQARNNYAATAIPGTGDDVSKDFAVGSTVIVPSVGKVYVCYSAALGAATWALLN